MQVRIKIGDHEVVMEDNSRNEIFKAAAAIGEGLRGAQLNDRHLKAIAAALEKLGEGAG